MKLDDDCELEWLISRNRLILIFWNSKSWHIFAYAPWSTNWKNDNSVWISENRWHFSCDTNWKIKLFCMDTFSSKRELYYSAPSFYKLVYICLKNYLTKFNSWSLTWKCALLIIILFHWLEKCLHFHVFLFFEYLVDIDICLVSRLMAPKWKQGSRSLFQLQVARPRRGGWDLVVLDYPSSTTCWRDRGVYWFDELVHFYWNLYLWCWNIHWL